MKYKNILPIIALAFMLFSCDENKMEWGKDPSHGPVTEAELPLPLEEQIAKYDSLTAYTNIILGIGVGMDLYMNDDNTSNIINSNFDEIAIGYAMKHDPMTNADGDIVFANADAFVAKAKENNKSIFGHCLIWHTNQNGTYLNSLIAPIVLPDTSASNAENLIPNGTFDTGLDGWTKVNGVEDAMTLASGTDVYEGDGAMKVYNDADGDEWSTQIQSTFAAPLESGEAYTISFMIRSESNGSIRCSTVGEAQYQGNQTTTTNWSLISWEIDGSGAETGLSLDVGKTAGTYYIDNVTVGKSDGTGGSIVIEKTDAEKKQLITDAMEAWISGMVGHYKNDIHAWDVVNEPIKDGSSGDVRDGIVNEDEERPTDEFYWVKYMGKDYAVEAFKMARQYGNASDILFINDYGLESNMDKCDGLISYVEYIEGKGATVDGIGTQMHISPNTDSALIIQMFQKLAASGKLIKVSELDVALGTANPTSEQLAAQADMYEFVAKQYNEIIPVDQQYGITIWSVSDNAKEHEYWLTDESPNLWDANYERKHAYKGFANGLAGRDVSKEFNGELVY